VISCPNNIPFQTLQAFIDHHSTQHGENRLSKKKCDLLDVVQCYKCHKLYSRDGSKCEHLNKKVANDPLDQSQYPEESWYVTIAAVCIDVPQPLLGDFDLFLATMQCSMAIACLERGDKENHLHLQAACAIT
jgi:hypothetical protein